MKQKREKYKRNLIFAAVILSAMLFSILVTLLTHREYKNELLLNEHWNASFQGAEYTDVSLSQIPLSRVGGGEKIVLTTTLGDIQMQQPTLSFRASHCAVEVYVDGKQIYSADVLKNQQGKLVGSGYYWIPLPSDFDGGELAIVLHTAKESTATTDDDIKIMPACDIFYSMISENFLAIVVSLFLIIIGILSWWGVPFVRCLGVSPRVLLSLSFFSLLMGTWMACEVKVAQFLITDLTKLSYVEYISLYAAPIAAASLLSVLLKRKRARCIMRGLEFYFMAFAGISLLLQLLGVRNLPQNLLLFQLSVLMAFVITFQHTRKEMTKGRSHANQVVENGMMVLFFFIAVEIIRHVLHRYFDFNLAGAKSLLPVGLLVLIVSMFLSFAFIVFEKVTVAVEKSTLLKMAYTDALTNINNRTKCEELLEDYATKKKPIQIINMDLNHFKEVNDTYGHLVGDGQLCLFANLLQEVYDGIGQVGRMGGDEFIVISDPMEKEYVQKTIMELKQKVQQKNTEEELPSKLSFAYGIATNRDDGNIPPWKIYEQADEDMYRCKRKQQKNGKIKRA